MALHLPDELTPAHVAFLDFVWQMELKYAAEIAADAQAVRPADLAVLPAPPAARRREKRGQRSTDAAA